MVFNLQRSRVAKRGSNVIRHLVLRRKIYLLEELGRDRQAACGSQSPESSIFIVRVMVQVIWTVAIDGTVTGMVLLDVGYVGCHCCRLLRDCQGSLFREEFERLID